MPAGPARRHRQRPGGRGLLRAGALAAACTLVYYLLPGDLRLSRSGWVVLFTIGVVVLAVVILLLVSRVLAAGPAARLQGLIAVMCVAVVFFAEADYMLSRLPGQFASMHTRTDALYFTVSTLATVGFGDVHATGQTARAAVTAQIVFNLVFLGTVVAIISSMARERVAQRQREGAVAGRDDADDRG